MNTALSDDMTAAPTIPSSPINISSPPKFSAPDTICDSGGGSDAEDFASNPGGGLRNRLLPLVGDHQQLVPSQQ
eukprot:936232-Rhodomonas_salina.2